MCLKHIIVYEAVQQDKPVVPMTIALGSDKSIQNVTETDLLNPYSVALYKNFDSEFQEESLTALNDADLSWSILTTQLQYKAAAQNCCFKPLNDSPLLCTFKKQNFDESECVEYMSAEHFEEVSCKLQNSSNFEEHFDVTTNYLGRYMAQGGPRMFNLENVKSLDGKGITTAHLFYKTEVKVFYDLGASKRYMAKFL